MPSTNKTNGELQLTQYIGTDIIDFIQDYNADMDKLAAHANMEKAREGAANGFAMLDSTGKLAQMPTATDVGARASDWLPSPTDIGAQPQTVARSSFVKADTSGNLVAGTVYQSDVLFSCGGTPRTTKGAVSLSGSLNAYNLIAVITAPSNNGYISHYTNLYFPATFGLSTAQSIWGIDNNTNTLKPGSIRFGYNGTSDDSTKLYLAAAPGSCGIYAVYGVKFGK